MKDITTELQRSAEAATLAVLRRFVPGNYRTLAEAYNPALDCLDISFVECLVIPPRRGLLGLLARNKLPVRDATIAAVLRQQGGWCLALDQSLGGHSAESLFFLRTASYPDQVVKPVVESTCRNNEGLILIRQIKDTFLVAVQATVLKAITKNHDTDIY